MHILGIELLQYGVQLGDLRALRMQEHCSLRDCSFPLRALLTQHMNNEHLTTYALQLTTYALQLTTHALQLTTCALQLTACIRTAAHYICIAANYIPHAAPEVPLLSTA